MSSNVDLVGLPVTVTLGRLWVRDTGVENLGIFFYFFPPEIKKILNK